jgi:hypothetical protein
MFDPLEYRNRTTEELNGPSLLNEVTELSGGRAFTVEKINDLPDIATKISTELRNQYILGYRPSDKSHDARWRKVKIKLRAPKGLPPLSVSAKTGYYGPALSLLWLIAPPYAHPHDCTRLNLRFLPVSEPVLTVKPSAGS